MHLIFTSDKSDAFYQKLSGFERRLFRIHDEVVVYDAIDNNAFGDRR